MQQICLKQRLCTITVLYKCKMKVCTLEIKRKISCNNQQTVFHNAHNCPVRSIHCYLRSMRWLQSSDKDDPLFPFPWILAILSVLALWGRKHPSDETSQYSKTHQFIPRARLHAVFSLSYIKWVGIFEWHPLSYFLSAENLSGLSEGGMLYSQLYIFLNEDSLVIPSCK